MTRSRAHSRIRTYTPFLSFSCSVLLPFSPSLSLAYLNIVPTQIRYMASPGVLCGRVRRIEELWSSATNLRSAAFLGTVDKHSVFCLASVFIVFIVLPLRDCAPSSVKPIFYTPLLCTHSVYSLQTRRSYTHRSAHIHRRNGTLPTKVAHKLA